MTATAISNVEQQGSAPSIEYRAPTPLRDVGLVSPRAKERIAAIVAPLALLALWELAVRSGALDVRFFPAPSQIVQTFYAMTFSAQWDQSLGHHLLVSLSRALIGFLFGAIPAVMLGAVMGLVPIVRAALQPVVGALFPIPKVAILPLLMLIFGIGEESKWAIIAVGVFFQVLIATSAGVANIDKIYLDVGQNFRAGRLNRYLTIALPGALPVIFAGLRLGWGSALLLLVTAEMVSSQSGIGFVIWRAWQLLTVEDMYVGLIVISIVGMCSFALLDAIERRLLPWKSRS
ncbi:ABC transporter permease [Diaphorobacter caeni]|uniref:ABC transporter permease n=1 Tax=Diaphorobacter caeni TaxID=2784387 RepID=UPI00188E0FD5|nr:ABC transporter permease [Diaphorobacter caeni]MBF5003817.1 ABC transporter permease [Diaphorobacter caeni]